MWLLGCVANAHLPRYAKNNTAQVLSLHSTILVAVIYDMVMLLLHGMKDGWLIILALELRSVTWLQKYTPLVSRLAVARHNFFMLYYLSIIKIKTVQYILRVVICRFSVSVYRYLHLATKTTMHSNTFFILLLASASCDLHVSTL